MKKQYYKLDSDIFDLLANDSEMIIAAEFSKEQKNVVNDQNTAHNLALQMADIYTEMNGYKNIEKTPEDLTGLAYFVMGYNACLKLIKENVK